MPAPAKVSSDQVLSAAAELRASGERVTGCSLRRVLGRGRPDRLMAIVEEHDALTALPVAPASPALPPAMADLVVMLEQRVIAEVRVLADEAWLRASDLASRRLEADLAESRSSLADARRDRSELNEALALADIERDQLLEQIANLQAEVRSGREQLLAIQGTLTEVRDRERQARDEILAARRQTDHARTTINEALDACTSTRTAPEAPTGVATMIKKSPEDSRKAERPLNVDARPELRRKRTSKLPSRVAPPDGASTLIAPMHG